MEDETKRAGGTFIPNLSLGNTANPFRLFSAANNLKKAVRDFEPDILACHSTMAGLLGRFTIRNQVPTVFTAHGWSFTQGAQSYRRLILPILERLAARFCKKIICVSKNDLQLAIEKKIAPKEKLVVIHNGVEITTRTPHHPTLAGEEASILFIGRLAAPKQPDLLIRALPENARLTIIGDGPDKPRLINLINQLRLQDRVILTGALSRTETLNALTRADIFVLPSRYEGLPYSILEAMAAGVPVIASDIGGVREAIGDDAGIVMPPNNLNALTEALKKLIGDAELRMRMGEAGRRKAETVFSLDTMRQKTLQVYLDMLTPHG